MGNLLTLCSFISITKNKSRIYLMNKYKEKEIVIKNHNKIEKSECSRCCKELRHFFEVICNNGAYGMYDDNLPSLLRRIKNLLKTRDEEHCFNILEIADFILQDDMLALVIKEWDSAAQCSMIAYGQNRVWDNITMLGQLWLLRRGFIDS